MNESQETREETDFSFNFADYVDHELEDNFDRGQDNSVLSSNLKFYHLLEKEHKNKR